MSQKVTPLSAQQINQLVWMQDHLNQLTCQANFGHTDWRSMGFNWGDAIVDEVMEIKGHMGWKWWKGSDKYKIGVTPENKKQIQLEVIDILHFALSFEMFWGDLPNEAVMTTLDLEDCLSELVQGKQRNLADWDVLYTLCCHLDLDASQIMETYIGKYALNIFRQDNGYGDGTYDKHWDIAGFGSQEDNWYLERVIDDIKSAGYEVTVEDVSGCLTQYYAMRVGE